MHKAIALHKVIFMAKIRVQILDFAAFTKLLYLVNNGGGASITGALMDGDFRGAMQEAKTSSDYIFSQEGFQELMNIAVKYGIAKFVVEATPLKRSFTLFGIEVGF